MNATVLNRLDEPMRTGLGHDHLDVVEQPVHGDARDLADRHRRLVVGQGIGRCVAEPPQIVITTWTMPTVIACLQETMVIQSTGQGPTGGWNDSYRVGVGMRILCPATIDAGCRPGFIARIVRYGTPNQFAIE